MKLSRNTALRINNILLYLGFSFLAGSGLLLVFRLPCGKTANLLGLSRHEWGDLHFYIALGVLALMLVHLVLNRAWLTKIAAKGGGWKLGAGLGLGIAIVGAFFTIPLQADNTIEMCATCADRENCEKAGCEEEDCGDCDQADCKEAEGCDGCEEEGCDEKEQDGCEGCDGCDEE